MSCLFRRGTLVAPVEVPWIIPDYSADLTSRSLRGLRKCSPPYIPPHAGEMSSSSPHAGRAGEGLDRWRGTPVVPVRRGVPVTPAEAHWIIKRNAPDPTSRSLRDADATSRSLRTTKLDGIRIVLYRTFVVISGFKRGKGDRFFCKEAADVFGMMITLDAVSDLLSCAAGVDVI